MEKMELYNKVRSVPEKAQKTITGGRLNGMTDISPIWRIETLTEQFGACGTGWKCDIDQTWTEQGADGELMCFMMVKLYYKVDKEWSDPVIGIGGSKLVQKERNGLYNNDEAYKMCYTDALGTACKSLGMAADIYWGQGGKYTQKQETPSEPLTPQMAANTVISFGKHKGKTIRELYKEDRQYLDWILEKSENEHIKRAVQTVYDEAKKTNKENKPNDPPIESFTQLEDSDIVE